MNEPVKIEWAKAVCPECVGVGKRGSSHCEVCRGGGWVYVPAMSLGYEYEIPADGVQPKVVVDLLEDDR